ncbi:unnamed protein product [Protopolystoma xenopodis]|uniref:Uncharacterized protein n=1 Tax=Protopolystoma xenopodis TaxID=117903 RepID=A0A3S5FEC3_9PLAT|nr:unnamed protein product [Protopolystoma xenopodis]
MVKFHHGHPAPEVANSLIGLLIHPVTRVLGRCRTTTTSTSHITTTIVTLLGLALIIIHQLLALVAPRHHAEAEVASVFQRHLVLQGTRVRLADCQVV